MKETLSVGERSAEYEHVVPNSAIREDNNGKFIFIIEEKSQRFIFIIQTTLDC